MSAWVRDLLWSLRLLAREALARPKDALAGVAMALALSGVGPYLLLWAADALTGGWVSSWLA